MTIRSYSVRITTAGVAGAAVGAGTIGLPPGRLVAFGINYHASAPATTDVTITNVGPSGTKTLVTVTSAVTDLPLRSLGELCKDSANADIAGQYVDPMVLGSLSIDVAQCDALTDAVVATFLVEH